MMEIINFKQMNKDFDDYDLLYKWCQNDFVYEWFEQRPLSYDEIKDKYSRKINDGLQKLFIVEVNEVPIGYFQYYKSDYDLDCYEYDIFIGEPDYLSKGYGTKIVDMINQYLYDVEHCSAIILRPFSRNLRAIHAYKKCGFEVIDEYLGKDTLDKDEMITVLRKR